MAQQQLISALQAPSASPIALRDTSHTGQELYDSPTTTDLNENSRTYAANERQVLALIDLGHALIDAGYDWICPSPQTQALVNGRFVNRKAHDLRGLFGWSRPGDPELLQALPAELVQGLCEAGVLQISMDRETVRSRVRFSSFAGTVLAHSAWPTLDTESVSFGPDTYRFGAFLERELGDGPARQWACRPAGSRPFTLVDVGCGTGAGGILAARLLEDHAEDATPIRVLFNDVNPRALRYTRCNAKLAGLSDHTCLQGDLLQDVNEPVDLVLASPPYLIDPQHRTFRHGGGELGTGLGVRVVEEALQRLAPGGRLLMCTGAPVVEGADVLWRHLQPLLARAQAEYGASYRYSLIHPDICGTELQQPDYAEVERLAAVSLSLQLPPAR